MGYWWTDEQSSGETEVRTASDANYLLARSTNVIVAGDCEPYAGVTLQLSLFVNIIIYNTLVRHQAYRWCWHGAAIATISIILHVLPHLPTCFLAGSAREIALALSDRRTTRPNDSIIRYWRQIKLFRLRPSANHAIRLSSA